MPKVYVFLLGIFIAFYVMLILITPPDPTVLERFGVDVLQIRLISLTLVALLAVIWYSAFYGFAKFKEYALKIKESPDGRAFCTLANGLGVLAFALPITSLVSTILDYYTRIHPELTAAIVITERYLALGLAAAAIVLIYRGSKDLVAITAKTPGRIGYLGGGIVVLIMGGLYAYIALSNTAASVPDPATGIAVYYLPPWLIVTTNIIPYTLVWLLGLSSVLHILFYKRNSQGLVYTRALSSFAAGLGLVVGGSIAVQIFTALGSGVDEWGAQLLLAFVYLLVIVMATGYVLIAIGAKKLKKIEEV